MSETDPGPLLTSRMEFMAPPYMPRLLYWPGASRVYHYPYYCYPGKSPALAIILLSLLYLFSSKPGKISTRNSIYSFLYLFILLYLR